MTKDCFRLILSLDLLVCECERGWRDGSTKLTGGTRAYIILIKLMYAPVELSWHRTRLSDWAGDDSDPRSSSIISSGNNQHVEADYYATF